MIELLDGINLQIRSSFEEVMGNFFRLYVS